MMQFYTVAFFGHRYINDIYKFEKHFKEQIRNLISTNQYIDFLVGRNGDFDQFVSSCIFNVRNNYRDDNSSLILVLPFVTAEYVNNKKNFEEYYSEIEISYLASKAHPKSAIQIRNREIVDRADLIMCYVEKNEGGAWKAVKYAIEQGKTVINLAEYSDNLY